MVKALYLFIFILLIVIGVLSYLLHKSRNKKCPTCPECSKGFLGFDVDHSKSQFIDSTIKINEAGAKTIQGILCRRIEIDKIKQMIKSEFVKVKSEIGPMLTCKKLKEIKDTMKNNISEDTNNNSGIEGYEDIAKSGESLRPFINVDEPTEEDIKDIKLFVDILFMEIDNMYNKVCKNENYTINVDDIINIVENIHKSFCKPK
jgi:hypothetical protein